MFGLDGEQQQAVKWAVKDIDYKLKLANENLTDIRERMEMEYAKSNNRYDEMLQKKEQLFLDRIRELKRHKEAFGTLFPPVTDK